MSNSSDTPATYDESSFESYGLPRNALRSSISSRTAVPLPAPTHVHTAQSTILEYDQETDVIVDTCPPTPGDPFRTPTGSAHASMHNLAFVELAGATVSQLSIHSPSYGFANLASGQGSAPLTRVSTAPGSISDIASGSGTRGTPPVPPFPPHLKRASRSSTGIDVIAIEPVPTTPPANPPHQRRESFAAPKMYRPSSAVSVGPNGRRFSQRPGTGGTAGSSTHLTPPGSAHSLSTDKIVSGAAFTLVKDRKVPALPGKRMACQMLEPDTVIEKPWIAKPERRSRISYWLTILLALFGIASSFLRCWYGAKDIQLLDGNLCMVFEDDFDGDTIDTNKWSWDVSLDGFGNGEFEMTTNSANNSFIEDGILYIVPTLTSDVIGTSAVFDGHTFNITGCTAANSTGCGAVSNITTRTVINPVQSARLTTRNATGGSIGYGKVEIRAKVATGDWIWPALWMLPVDNTYGDWPLSGEIDIMEARGNNRFYPAQGVNFVRGSLNWGPLSWLNEGFRTFGWWDKRRRSFDQDFHTYSLEWSDKFIRVYVDTRLQLMLHVTFNEPFFQRGKFPPTVFNGTSEIPVPNPWGLDSFSAPFDQQFYLIMNVAVGGTNGWFPDNVGDKPWLDKSDSAMYDFARAQDEWYSTWPQDPRERGMAVDYVKMWQLC